MTMATQPAGEESYDDIFSPSPNEQTETPSADVETVDKPATQPRDEGGRFTSKEQAQDGGGEEPPAEGQEDPGSDGSQDPDRRRHVPLSELISERKTRQTNEQQLTAALARADALEKLLNQTAGQRQPQQQPAEEIPDAFSDPQGYVSHVLKTERAQQREAMLNVYEDMTRVRHGDEKVNAALQAAQQADVVSRLVQQQNPWTALMKWHQGHVMQTEIGGDFEAYKKRVADEAVQKALAGLKNGGGSAAPPPQKFPGSLAAATATGRQGAILTDEQAASDVFGSDRRSRRTA